MHTVSTTSCQVGPKSWAYWRVGHAGSVPLHNPGFVLDDAILPVGASIYARIVETRLPKVGG